MQMNSEKTRDFHYHNNNHPALKREKAFHLHHHHPDHHHNNHHATDGGEEDDLFYRRQSDQCSEHSTSSGVDVDGESCSSAGGEGDAESSAGEEENCPSKLSSSKKNNSPSNSPSSPSSIYGGDGLSSEGASSHNEGDDDASSDSGNSTDRNSKGSRPVLLHDRRTTISRSKIPVKAPDPSSRSSDEGTLGGELSHMDKVMIVTGDSQNMVVDLSGVPQDLREAIISGTALITLPDGLTTSSANKKGGYTIISLPNNSSSPSTNANPSSPTPPYRPPSTGSKTTGHKKKSPLSTSQTEAENEIKVIPTIPSTSVNINVSQLERGELYDHIFNSSKFNSKNKTRVWDMMQQSVQQTLIEGEKGKKKRITTVLPFHPNQDVYKSPDFTMEGHRLEHQRKKLDIAKKRRCACRVFGIFFFLATFIGVLVALSMIYTKGQRYFGSV